MTAVPANPADPRLEIDVAVCAELGIPLGEFLAWPSSDRDEIVRRYLRKVQTESDGVTWPAEWDPDTGQQS